MVPAVALERLVYLLNNKLAVALDLAVAVAVAVVPTVALVRLLYL